MIAYGPLARYYDRLTTDVDYPAFADYYETLFARYGLQPHTVLDLACGTGTLTGILAARGYEMIGVDGAAEMLSVAAEKAEQLSGCIRPMFLNQAMEELDLYGTVDAAVCSLDGINYLPREDVAEVFRRLHLFIRPGGLLVFDINARRFLRELDGQVFLDEDEDVFCVWRSEYDWEQEICYYGMDLFSRREDGSWDRSFEEHVEYGHGETDLIRLLEQHGFTETQLFGPFSELPPREEDDRIFIAARREE